jgi:hypothetical protein
MCTCRLYFHAASYNSEHRGHQIRTLVHDDFSVNLEAVVKIFFVFDILASQLYHINFSSFFWMFGQVDCV